jgi:hypothetical protein
MSIIYKESIMAKGQQRKNKEAKKPKKKPTPTIWRSCAEQIERKEGWDTPTSPIFQASSDNPSWLGWLPAGWPTSPIHRDM